jgi:glycosyltransferase involved in cell wall biosynthesis
MEATPEKSKKPAHVAASSDPNFTRSLNRKPNSYENRRKATNNKSLALITELVLDRHLHRTQSVEILRALANRGFDVELCAIRSKERYSTDDLKVCSIPLRYKPVIHQTFFSLIMFLFLPIYVLVKKPRFIMTEPSPSILAFLWKPVLSKCTKVKVILDIRSTPVEVHGWQEVLKSLFFRISVLIAKRTLDGITIITSPMREEIAKNFQIDPDEIGVWTEGVSTQHFDPAKYLAEGADLRRQYGLTNAFVVLYHGNLTMNRGLIESARSLEMLPRGKYDDVVLFILGSGPAVPTMMHLVDERGLHGRVIFHGPVHYNQVPKYIAMADVGLVPLPNHPDWIHQCPLNLLEYLAMDKPVIVTDIPCNRWIVGNSKCGTYVKDADPKEFAKAITYLHDNRKLLKQWGSQGRRIVGQRFQWDIAAEALEKYLVSR